MIGDTLPTLADFAHIKAARFVERAEGGERTPPESNLACARETFWNLIYRDHSRMTLTTAKLVAEQIAASSVKVQDVIDGWRPEALTA